MSEGNVTGGLYFILHLLVEIICFALLGSKYPVEYVSLTIILYDTFAFVPQGVLGEIIFRFKKVDFASLAVAFIGISIFLFEAPNFYVHIAAILFLTIGNAILHEYGAIETVRDSKGKLTPSAVFVAGGSFGVVLGKFYNKLNISLYFLLILVVLLEVLVLYLKHRSKDRDERLKHLAKVNICRENIPVAVILLSAFFVTAIRGFIGYAIPTSWCETVPDFFLLFFLMGTGKALGGILADRFGAGIVGVSSTLLCIPMIVLGRNVTVVSVIGVMLFSMTMAITFGMTLNALENNPGIAFGITTIGLYVGSMVPEFYRPDLTMSCILVTVLSVVCSIFLFLTLKMSCNKKNEKRTVQ